LGGIYEIERGNCSGAVARPTGSVALHELALGDKFVVVHQDGSVSDTVWYLIKVDGSYGACTKRPEGTPEEYVFIRATAPVKKIG
jgi:hypothetical protein